MLKKTIRYDDLDGGSQVEDVYFHLYTNQLAELSMQNENYGTMLQNMVKAGKQKEVYEAFKQIVGLAYGKRSADGRRFVKATPEQLYEFLNGPLFDALFMEIVTDEAKALEFIMGILPKDMLDSAEVKKAFTDIQLPAADLHVPPMEELKFPASGVTPDPEQNVPAAFKRPPADQADRMLDAGAITIPEELQKLTRDEILAAYDRQIAKNRGEDPPPAA